MNFKDVKLLAISLPLVDKGRAGDGFNKTVRIQDFMFSLTLLKFAYASTPLQY